MPEIMGTPPSSVTAWLRRLKLEGSQSLPVQLPIEKIKHSCSASLNVSWQAAASNMVTVLPLLNVTDLSAKIWGQDAVVVLEVVVVVLVVVVVVVESVQVCSQMNCD